MHLSLIFFRNVDVQLHFTNLRLCIAELDVCKMKFSIEKVKFQKKYNLYAIIYVTSSITSIIFWMFFDNIVHLWNTWYLNRIIQYEDNLISTNKNFSSQGRRIPTPNKCSTVMVVLLYLYSARYSGHCICKSSRSTL